MVKKLGATVAVALLLATSACGAGRPSEEELSTAMQKGVKTDDQTVKLTKEQADCAAKIFVKSELSDEALQAITERDQTYKESKSDAAALEKIEDDLGACV
jgi:hypothetical protein